MPLQKPKQSKRAFVHSFFQSPFQGAEWALAFHGPQWPETQEPSTECGIAAYANIEVKLLGICWSDGNSALSREQRQRPSAMVNAADAAAAAIVRT